MVGYWIKLSNGMSYFEFEDNLFKSMAEMINHIIQTKSIISLDEACVFNIGFKKDGETTKNKVQICESFKSFLKKDVKKKEYKIRNKNVHSVKTYTCYGKTFTNFDDALSYMLNTKCVIKTPNDVNHLDHKCTTFKPSVLPKESCVTFLTGKRCLTRDTGGYSIWLNTWKKSYGNCFQQQNFKVCKQKYVKELNGYRRLHGLKPLIGDSVLFFLAQKHAFSMSKVNTLLNDSNGLTKEIVGYTRADMGKYFLKILFDSYNNYKKIPKHLRVKKEEFGGFMSSKTTLFGIGISQKYDKIFVILMFK